MNTPDDGFRGMGNVLNLLLWGPILFFGGLFLLAIFLGLRPQKNNNQPSDIDVEKLARGGMKYQSGITALLIAITNSLASGRGCSQNAPLCPSR